MTGHDLICMALDLCGLKQNESSLPSDTADLEARALSLINILLAENASLDCRIKKTEHKVLKLESIAEIIGYSDIVVSTVLPYGLARLFMLGEDDKAAADFERLYENAKENALRFGKAQITEITEVYD